MCGLETLPFISFPKRRPCPLLLCSLVTLLLRHLGRLGSTASLQRLDGLTPLPNLANNGTLDGLTIINPWAPLQSQAELGGACSTQCGGVSCWKQLVDGSRPGPAPTCSELRTAGCDCAGCCIEGPQQVVQWASVVRDHDGSCWPLGTDRPALLNDFDFEVYPSPKTERWSAAPDNPPAQRREVRGASWPPGPLRVPCHEGLNEHRIDDLALMGLSASYTVEVKAIDKVSNVGIGRESNDGPGQQRVIIDATPPTSTGRPRDVLHGPGQLLSSLDEVDEAGFPERESQHQLACEWSGVFTDEHSQIGGYYWALSLDGIRDDVWAWTDVGLEPAGYLTGAVPCGPDLPTWPPPPSSPPPSSPPSDRRRFPPNIQASGPSVPSPPCLHSRVRYFCIVRAFNTAGERPPPPLHFCARPHYRHVTLSSPLTLCVRFPCGRGLHRPCQQRLLTRRHATECHRCIRSRLRCWQAKQRWQRPATCLLHLRSCCSQRHMGRLL